MSELVLKKSKSFDEYAGPLVTIILDGIGLAGPGESNGVYVANTPVLDDLFSSPLFCKLKAHGTAVGLPTDKDMGNSEVGHNALGAGRVFAQGARLVNEAIATGKIFEGRAWSSIKERAKAGGCVHLIGLTSDGNVHSHINQLYALVDRCALEGFRQLRVHTLLDGRDVGERSALDYIVPLEAKLNELSQGDRDYRIASGGGRMVTTMDRYNADWSVVKRGWDAHVLGRARFFPSASLAIKTYYDEDPSITDQYMDSFVVADNGSPVGRIVDGDAVVFFNFRGDRAIEISRAFDEEEFSEFDRQSRPDVFFAGLMEYDGDAHIPRNYLVEPPAIDNTLGQFLCASGVTSFASAETQKFGHVTYFWNGNNSGYIDESLEKYVEVPSDRITFDLKPWMKAGEVADEVIRAIACGKYKFIRLNFANGDMVGHTGIVPAVRIAVETVDLCTGRILKAIEQTRGVVMVTADHGNADIMWTEKNGKRSPHVAHTLNPVPFVIRDYSGSSNNWKLSGIDKPGLSNVAATICTLLGYQPPEEYDASLVIPA